LEMRTVKNKGFSMHRKYFLMFFFIVLLTFTAAQNSIAKPVRPGLTTSVTLGLAVIPIPGIRFQYRINDTLSLNGGLSYIIAAGDFNAGINVHLPLSSIDPYLGVKKIFIYHLMGDFNLNAFVAGFQFEKYFVEAGLGFGQERTDWGSTKTELAVFQAGWFF